MIYFSFSLSHIPSTPFLPNLLHLLHSSSSLRFTRLFTSSACACRRADSRRGIHPALNDAQTLTDFPLYTLLKSRNARSKVRPLDSTPFPSITHTQKTPSLGRLRRVLRSLGAYAAAGSERTTSPRAPHRWLRHLLSVSLELGTRFKRI